MGGCLRSPQDKTIRQTLLAELDNLDDQTARADAYSNLRSASVRYQVGLAQRSRCCTSFCADFRLQ